jgi:hypothetical protein
MNAILRNPYHFCGAIIARLAVCGATILWSLIVLVRKDALAPTAYGSIMLGLAPEDVFAWAYLLLACALVWRIFARRPPHWFGIVAYGILMCAWGFVDIVLWLTRPWQPTAIAWVTPGAALAVYAFLANRRPKRCSHDPGLR